MSPDQAKRQQDERKLRRMQAGAERDAARPQIREIAVHLVKDLPSDAWARIVEKIHEFSRDIRYVHDPNRKEDLRPALTVIRRGFDDCDGKVRVAVALARSMGIEAVTKPIWKGPMLAHVQAAYRWPGSQRYAGSGPGGWVVGETTVKGAGLGQDPREIPRNPSTGKYPTP